MNALNTVVPDGTAPASRVTFRPRRVATDRFKKHPVACLPFVQSNGRGQGRDFWSVEPTGDYWTDFAAGQRLGRAAAIYTRMFEAGPAGSWLLGHVVADIVRKQDTSAVPRGFMQAYVEGVTA